LEDLEQVLKKMPTLSKDEINKKTSKAYNLISTKFKWENYRDRTEKFISNLDTIKPFELKKRLAWVSSYNSKCGVATYSSFLIKNLNGFDISVFANYTKESIDTKIEDTIIRCWNNRFDVDHRDLITSILIVVSSKGFDKFLNFWLF